ncbi:MAG TPA: methyltransferase domain-containing protein [Candidatus Angelobacter sp.]|nr:methyltransferase domain-containing protein [Candidatus Angelobacter sp.]
MSPTLRAVARKVALAVTDPRRLSCYLRWQWNRRFVRRVELPTGVFHHYRGRAYPDYLNSGDACSFVRERALVHCTGSGLDIGADAWPLPGSIPIREGEHQNAYRLDAFPDGSLDFVFSSHCLEHLRHWPGALRLWIRKLKPGGRLFLYLPHPSMLLWRRAGPWVGLRHEWIPTWAVLVPFLERNGIEVMEYDKEHDTYWSFSIVGRRTR